LLSQAHQLTLGEDGAEFLIVDKMLGILSSPKHAAVFTTFCEPYKNVDILGMWVL